MNECTKKPLFADDGRSLWAERVPACNFLLSPKHADGLDQVNDSMGSQEAGYEVDAAGTFKDQS